MIKVLIFYKKWQTCMLIKKDDKKIEYYINNFVCEYI